MNDYTLDDYTAAANAIPADVFAPLIAPVERYTGSDGTDDGCRWTAQDRGGIWLEFCPGDSTAYRFALLRIGHDSLSVTLTNDGWGGAAILPCRWPQPEQYIVDKMALGANECTRHAVTAIVNRVVDLIAAAEVHDR